MEVRGGATHGGRGRGILMQVREGGEDSHGGKGGGVLLWEVGLSVGGRSAEWEWAVGDTSQGVCVRCVCVCGVSSYNADKESSRQ